MRLFVAGGGAGPGAMLDGDGVGDERVDLPCAHKSLRASASPG